MEEERELVEVTIVLKELEGKRVSMECSHPIDLLNSRIKSGETLQGAEAVAHWIQWSVIERTKQPAKPKPKIFVPKLIT